MDPTTVSFARPPSAAPQPRSTPEAQDPLREAAKSFEAVFLAEMFSHVGLGAPRKENGGGAGEEAFASFLSREWANEIADKGGVGLADEIYKSLAAKESGHAR